MTNAEDTRAARAVLDLILARRSVGRLLPDRPPREAIETLLAAACSAPNHHHTQPWRFLVLAGDARDRAGDALMAALKARLADPSTPASQALLQKELTKLRRAPVVIVVAVQPSTAPGVIRQEEVAAGAAACQNVLLAAQAIGLGVMWRTGETAYEASVRSALGFEDDAEIVGFLYVGYPDPAQPPGPRPQRRPCADLARWWGWE